jgi:hypothetical protein
VFLAITLQHCLARPTRTGAPNESSATAVLRCGPGSTGGPLFLIYRHTRRPPWFCPWTHVRKASRTCHRAGVAPRWRAWPSKALSPNSDTTEIQRGNRAVRHRDLPRSPRAWASKGSCANGKTCCGSEIDRGFPRSGTRSTAAVSSWVPGSSYRSSEHQGQGAHSTASRTPAKSKRSRAPTLKTYLTCENPPSPLKFTSTH